MAQNASNENDDRVPFFKTETMSLTTGKKLTIIEFSFGENMFLYF